MIMDSYLSISDDFKDKEYIVEVNGHPQSFYCNDEVNDILFLLSII